METLVHDFADDNPDVVVTVLRFANVLGTDIVTPITKNLSRPLCPSIFGFDPLCSSSKRTTSSAPFDYGGAPAAVPRSYTYEHDVEQFFRHSPSVVQAGDG